MTPTGHQKNSAESSLAPMSLAFSRWEGVAYFWVFGSLTHRDTCDLEESFRRVLLFTEECKGVVLNLSHLQFVDADGVAALNRLARIAVGPLYRRKLVGVEPPEPVRSRLARTRIFREIPWFTSSAEATAYLHQESQGESTRPSWEPAHSFV